MALAVSRFSQHGSDGFYHDWIQSINDTNSDYSQPKNNDDHTQKACQKNFDEILHKLPHLIVHQEKPPEPNWAKSTFVTECLQWHNYYRNRHQAPPLELSLQLCSSAQHWANVLAHTEVFKHSNNPLLGENIYCRVFLSAKSDVSGRDVCSYWYSRGKKYDVTKNPSLLHAHADEFTQMVWKSSRLFGVGKARTRMFKMVVVAHYDPPGNDIGKFSANVLPCLPSPQNSEVSSDKSTNGISAKVEPFHNFLTHLIGWKPKSPRLKRSSELNDLDRFNDLSDTTSYESD